MESFCGQLSRHLIIIIPLFPQFLYSIDHFIIAGDILLAMHRCDSCVI